MTRCSLHFRLEIPFSHRPSIEKDITDHCDCSGHIDSCKYNDCRLELLASLEEPGAIDGIGCVEVLLNTKVTTMAGTVAIKAVTHCCCWRLELLLRALKSSVAVHERPASEAPNESREENERH